MVEVKTFGDGSDLQLIHGYGDGGFRVSQERYAGDLFLLSLIHISEPTRPS